MRLNFGARVSALPPVALARAAAKAGKIIWKDQGFGRSVRERACVDARGTPVPWYTFPAIEFLSQLDFREKTVFEYGSGHSTLFWASRAARVTSVEHSPEWFETIARRVGPTGTILLETDPAAYIRAIERNGDAYDVVVVDGLVPGRARAQGAVLALRHLRAGGMVILDNSDYLPGSTALLRQSGLIQIDLSGLGPCNPYAWTTSLFLTRDYAFRPLGDCQPQHPAGGLHYNWEPGLERRLKETGVLDQLPRQNWAATAPEDLLRIVTG
jgi:hypothetical protein